MTKDAITKPNERALLLEVKNEPRSAEGLIRAAVLLLVDTDDLPNFIQRQERQGQIIFKYLPQIAPIEWSIWIAATKQALRTVAAAA